MIHVGDCLEVMRALAANSVDAIVTDPPYHLLTGKKGGSGEASVNLNTPQGRARITTGFMGKAWDGGDIAHRPETWAEALRVAKPGAWLAAFGGTRTYHRLACAIEDAGWELRDCGLRGHTPEDCDWLAGWIYGSGFPKSHNGEWGGTALKPAWEPIVLARKPLEGTVEANWRKYGTGALNIDACRVATAGEERGPITGRGGIPARNNESAARDAGVVAQPHELGRWPANVIHDGSDEVLACFPEAPGQQRASRDDQRTQGAVYGVITNNGGRFFEPRGDVGSAARFFYCAKASREDRNDGCEGMPLGMPLAPNGAENAIGSKRGSNSKPRENIHPTVKPTELMRWLCRLVTPPGGLVLDPFCGSGSTGRGAIAEGMQFIGIELDPDYARIAEARIRAVQPGLALALPA